MGTAKGTKPWNAGTGKGWVDKRGYRWLYVVEGGRKVARREHRVLMEQHLGRKLEPWELVHHKNGDTKDNRLDNLEVQEFGKHTRLHHCGTRRSQDARRSFEAFAILREELKRTRKFNSELLGACRMMRRWMNANNCDDPEIEALTLQTVMEHVDTAIARAEGREQ